MSESKTETSLYIFHGKAGLSKSHKGVGGPWEILLGKSFIGWWESHED